MDEIYDCRDCGEQLPTRLQRRRGSRRTFAEYRSDPVSCQNPSCPRYQLPIVFGQAVARDARG